MRNALGRILLGACGVALVGCVEVAELRPLEAPPDVAGTVAAAYHHLQVGTREVAQVRVTARPIRAEPNEPARAVLDLRVLNLDRTALRVDAAAASLEVQSEEGDRWVCGPATVSGEVRVEPGATAWVELAFALPAQVAVREVAGVELTWRLDTGAGPLVRSTPFVRARPVYRGARYPASLHYDGWTHPGWCDDPWHVHWAYPTPYPY